MSTEIEVSNPSPYGRSDYVEVDLDRLGVPQELDETSLRLLRVLPSRRHEEVLFQIDHIMGPSAGKRVLTFFSEKTPAGPDDYSAVCATYLLEQVSGSQRPTTAVASEDLRIDHFYQEPAPDEPEDGRCGTWDRARRAYAVRLDNRTLQCYFSLVPHLGGSTEVDYTGSMTSILLREAPSSVLRASDDSDNMLSPRDPWFPRKRWGQLVALDFCPLPWEDRPYRQVPLLGRGYDLVWSRCGPVRAVVSVRSQPMMLRYNTAPVLGDVELTGHLYRVLSLYPGRPCYSEDVFVRADAILVDGRDMRLVNGKLPSIAFRPRFLSQVYHGLGSPDLRRFEHIPEYFSMWRSWIGQSWGYAFAADLPSRDVAVNGDEIRWRLPLTHGSKCIHLFMFYGLSVEDKSVYPPSFNPFQRVGHEAWYEQAWKPLALAGHPRRQVTVA